MEEPVLLAELRRRRLLALERGAQPPTAEEREAVEERRAEEATAARLRALGVRTPAPQQREAARAQPEVTAAVPQPRPPQPERSLLDNEAFAEPICRICHGGAELGRLFSPCRCRGTARFVHPSCLAAWRTISEGRESFYVCDVCGFRYNVRRAAWAGVLQSRALVLGVTAALLIAAVMAVGFACRAASLRIHLHFYNLVSWLPPWYNSARHRAWRAFGLPRTLDALISGAVLCGLAGTAAAAHAAWREDPQQFLSRALPSIVMSFASSGTPLLRFFVAGGLYFGYIEAARAAGLCAKQVLTRFGERVLDVNAAESDEAAAAAVRDLTE
jgi:hypothetical protein